MNSNVQMQSLHNTYIHTYIHTYVTLGRLLQGLEIYYNRIQPQGSHVPRSRDPCILHYTTPPPQNNK